MNTDEIIFLRTLINLASIGTQHTDVIECRSNCGDDGTLAPQSVQMATCRCGHRLQACCYRVILFVYVRAVGHTHTLTQPAAAAHYLSALFVTGRHRRYCVSYFRVQLLGDNSHGRGRTAERYERKREHAKFARQVHRPKLHGRRFQRM